MTDSDKLAIAAHMYVLLRRATGRVLDVEWLVRDRIYAREIVQLALSRTDQAELQRWARKLEAALELTPAAPVPVQAEEAEAADSVLSSTLSPPSTLGLSTLSPPSTLEDSRIGDPRPPVRSPAQPRYVGRLR